MMESQKFSHEEVLWCYTCDRQYKVEVEEDEIQAVRHCPRCKSQLFKLVDNKQNP